jgi:hypothetical protein
MTTRNKITLQKMYSPKAFSSPFSFVTCSRRETACHRPSHRESQYQKYQILKTASHPPAKTKVPIQAKIPARKELKGKVPTNAQYAI